MFSVKFSYQMPLRNQHQKWVYLDYIQFISVGVDFCPVSRTVTNFYVFPASEIILCTKMFDFTQVEAKFT